MGKDLGAMTVADLKKELKKHGLDQVGLKKELVKRLQEFLDGDEGEAEASTSSKRKKADSDEEEVAGKGKGKAPSRVSKRVKKPVKAEEAGENSGEEEDNAVEEKEDATDAAEYGKWVQEGSIFVLDPPSMKGNEKIAGFDMDDTMIETKSGKTFAKSRQDWQWLFPSVPEKMKQLHKDGYKIVIFTNQGGIHAGTSKFNPTKASQIKGKIIDLAKDLGFPIQAFAAGADDQYRKPSPFVWKRMVDEYNHGVAPDLAKSYYVGDAAGRVAGWKGGKKKDFACTDRKFAHNVGIAFHTPEEFFEGEAVCTDFSWEGVDISSVVPAGKDGEVADPDSLTEGGVASLTKQGQEMVIYVGFPASGKTTLTKRYMIPKGYFHVNKDTLKDQKRCVKAAKEAVARKESVVIDNTSPKAETRKEYIDIAKAAGIPVRCFRFDLELELAQHLNMFRERITNGEHHHVPRIAYATYKKSLQEPQMSEGFTEIKKIKFVPIFESDEMRSEFEKKA